MVVSSRWHGWTRRLGSCSVVVSVLLSSDGAVAGYLLEPERVLDGEVYAEALALYLGTACLDLGVPR